MVAGGDRVPDASIWNTGGGVASDNSRAGYHREP